MNEQVFLKTVHAKARELQINPLLLLSGIEGLYTFRDVQLNAANATFLDSLILTIFALRIGDHFHTLAEENLHHQNAVVRLAAGNELAELDSNAIAHSSNPYLQSFASVLNGKSTIRRYHEKALEVAAQEIEKTQGLFQNNSISTIMIRICKTELSEAIDLDALFNVHA